MHREIIYGTPTPLEFGEDEEVNFQKKSFC